MVICSQYTLIVLKKLFFSTNHLEDGILSLFQFLIPMAKNTVAIDTVILTKSVINLLVFVIQCYFVIRSSPHMPAGSCRGFQTWASFTSLGIPRILPH